MLNLFVPARGTSPLKVVRGLKFQPDGEIQSDFASRFARTSGAILVGSGPQGCLCGFSDWDALVEIARDALSRERVPELVALRFWSRERYSLTERIVDLDEVQGVVPAMGELVRMRVLAPEQRRHREIVRALERSLTAVVTLRLRSGEVLEGTLEAFDAESDVGTIDGRPFVAWEILEVRGT